MVGFRRDLNALLWHAERETIRIEPWGHDSLRVRATCAESFHADTLGALIDPAPTEPSIDIIDAAAVIRNGRIAAHVSADGLVRFIDAITGAELLRENSPHFVWPPARFFRCISGDVYHVEAQFAAYPGERIYGLGQHQHGLLDQKGCVLNLIQLNTEVSIPFVLSSRGYGFLWNNPAIGRVELGENGTRWVAEATSEMDYWITVGQSPAAIMEHYADATGHPPLLPHWASGFWQSKLRYQTQDELLAIAREYKRRGLPLSVIVADYFHWTLMGDWKFSADQWPDVPAMVRELDQMGVKLMVSIWPSVNALSSNSEVMQRRGLLVSSERGLPTQLLFMDTRPDGPVYLRFYDATNPEARQFLWEQVRQNYYRHGIKLWWLDACEPESYPAHAENLRYHLGNGQVMGNIYPMMHAKTFYDGMRSEGEQDVISLCRSAWAGSQRYGAAVWSGDIQSTFEALQAQVRSGLNIGLSGIPWWTTDIGGFHNGNTSTPYFRELVIRWFQYGVFCPLFRLHGKRLPGTNRCGGPNEVWSFGDEAYAIIKELLFLRERLRPYIHQQMTLAHEKGAPPMRPLFFDFPSDQEAWGPDDEFMFGPDLLVAPVLHQGARQRGVYLPKGATWLDAWTGMRHDGGKWLTADAPLDRIPLYLRDGARLPIRP